MRKIAICIAGLNGAVGSTLVAGVNLLRRGLAQPQALISEPFVKSHHLPAAADILFAGWDPRDETLTASAQRNQVLPAAQLAPIQRDLAKLKPWPAAKNHSAAARNLEKFRQQHKLDTVIVLNLLPTDENRASAEYARAAALTGCPFINFTPNDCGEDRLGAIPFAGRDGKTGQTWLKSVLAPAFQARRLKVTGWFSTNLLGNEDGKVVGDPVKGRQKIRDKTKLLSAMLGYDPFHLVQINYFPPRGDTKESWDYIEIEGFLGLPMQFRISAQYRDSVLAAPMCLDLARFITLAHRQGARGPQTWLSLFFKAPYADREHDFARQHHRLLAHLGC
jgi:myo-inositol-1-phosphate synthase